MQIVSHDFLMAKLNFLGLVLIVLRKKVVVDALKAKIHRIGLNLARPGVNFMRQS